MTMVSFNIPEDFKSDIKAAIAASASFASFLMNEDIVVIVPRLAVAEVDLHHAEAMPKGFRDRFESNLPIQVSEVRTGARPLEAAAKGALVAALAEM